MKRRSFLKKAVYTAPVVIVLGHLSVTAKANAADSGVVPVPEAAAGVTTTYYSSGGSGGGGGGSSDSGGSGAPAPAGFGPESMGSSGTQDPFPEEQ